MVFLSCCTIEGHYNMDYTDENSIDMHFLHITIHTMTGSFFTTRPKEQKHWLLFSVRQIA